MRIKSAKCNNRKKCIEVQTAKGSFCLPYSKLHLKPTRADPIERVFVDSQLARCGVTYLLNSGKEDSVHFDAFLDYNKDPEFLRNIALHKLSIEAVRLMKKSDLSKNEVIRRLKTSPSQLYRLLDTSNYKKSIDEMLRLLSVLGYRVEWSIVKEVA